MRWMWIDRVLELVPGQRIVTIKNISLAEEHLHDHFAADAPGAPEPRREALPVMPASLILEGMAQSGGLLVGHAAGFRENVVLAKIGRAELTRDAGPGMTLRYTVSVVRTDPVGASTAGTIELLDHAAGGAGGAEFERIGTVEMMFSMLDNNMGAAGAAGDAFPAHNFVFCNSFRTLLRASGIEW